MQNDTNKINEDNESKIAELLVSNCFLLGKAFFEQQPEDVKLEILFKVEELILSGKAIIISKDGAVLLANAMFTKATMSAELDFKASKLFTFVFLSEAKSRKENLKKFRESAPDFSTRLDMFKTILLNTILDLIFD
jgi:hypothetical protein